jgi:site-specific recombinase XerD
VTPEAGGRQPKHKETKMTRAAYTKLGQDLQLANYRPSTMKAYRRCVERFLGHYRRPVAELREQEVRGFLLHLINEKKAGPENEKMHLAALRFFFETTLGRPEEVVRIPWPKVPRRLPDILSGTEVEKLLLAVEPPKYRAVVVATYAAGLRISEGCSLLTSDIDSKRMLIHVRNGKRGRDRYVMLAQRLLVLLREYWKLTRPAGPYLFPGQEAGAPVSPTAVRCALRGAAEKTGLTKRVTPHTLRHAFATHLLETGTDIRTIQVLLGHSSIRSTTIYTRVSTQHIGRVTSPLDRLGTREGAVLG